LVTPVLPPDSAMAIAVAVTASDADHPACMARW
jgi:hypothetical protein